MALRGIQFEMEGDSIDAVPGESRVRGQANAHRVFQPGARDDAGEYQRALAGDQPAAQQATLRFPLGGHGRAGVRRQHHVDARRFPGPASRVDAHVHADVHVQLRAAAAHGARLPRPVRDGREYLAQGIVEAVRFRAGKGRLYPGRTPRCHAHAARSRSEGLPFKECAGG